MSAGEVAAFSANVQECDATAAELCSTAGTENT